MPTLPREPDLFPDGLLDSEELDSEEGYSWWVLYTRSRREKELMRWLRSIQIAHYSPLVSSSPRKPGGRSRTAYLPLFPNYVFTYGDVSQRYDALRTNCVSRWLEVPNGASLRRDLREIHRLIATDLPLSPEPCLEPGQAVRIISGPLTGRTGALIKRHGKDRLLVAVDFLQQGASVLLDSVELEVL